MPMRVWLIWALLSGLPNTPSALSSPETRTGGLPSRSKQPPHRDPRAKAGGFLLSAFHLPPFFQIAAPIAQLDRASASGAEGRRFDSCWVRHGSQEPVFDISICVVVTHEYPGGSGLVRKRMPRYVNPPARAGARPDPTGTQPVGNRCPVDQQVRMHPACPRLCPTKP